VIKVQQTIGRMGQSFTKFTPTINFIWVLNSIGIFVISWLIHDLKLSSAPYIAYNLCYVLIILLWRKKIELESIRAKSFIIGVLFLIFSPVIFENDFYRYIWEGKVLLNGYNPYELSPSDPILEKIIYQDKNKVAFSDLPTIYPPLSLLLFSVVSSFSVNTFTPLILLGLLNALIIFGLIGLLVKSKVKAYQLVLVFPLLGKEFINSVHIDLFSAFFVFCILFKDIMKDRLNPKNELILILLSFLSKVIGLFYLYTWLLKNYKTLGRNKTTFLLLSCLLIVFSYSLYIFNLPSNNGSAVFIKHWVWNAGIFSYFWRLGMNLVTARSISFFLFTFVILFIVGLGIKQRNSKNIKSIGEELILIFYLCLCFMMPTYNAWYAIWFAIPALLTKNKWGVLYSSFSFFSYTYYYDEALVPLGEFLSHIWFWPAVLYSSWRLFSLTEKNN
jgi:alpha-1,6-mannosyltransferase